MRSVDMRVLLACDGTLEDIAAIRKLHLHRCFVLTHANIDLPFVTACTQIPKLKFDVAVELNNTRLDVDCKCVSVQRNPVRIYLREDGTNTLLEPGFTQQLIQHQPTDQHVRTQMERHLFNTLVTRTPMDVPTQMKGLSKFVHKLSVYQHRFSTPKANVPHFLEDLAATIAYVANGTYNHHTKTFSGSLHQWRKRLTSFHIPCTSLVAVAVALTPTSDLPVHTLQRII